MEAAVGTAAGKIAPKLFDFLVKNHKLRAELEHDIQYIKKEFLMISAAIGEDDDDERSGGDDVHSAWVQMVRDLAHNIEDCIDRFIHRVTLEPGSSWFRQKLHQAKTVRARDKFAKAIRRLRKTSEEASVLRERYKREAVSNKLRTNQDSSDDGGSRSTILESDEETDATVGMDTTRHELMELIMETPQGQQPTKELKVISIVGFGGIGKTLLARQAYEDTIEKRQYQARAWVRAAEKGARDVLKEILRQLGMHSTTISTSGGSSCNLSKLRASLKECLGTKRFFIVIDDMRTVFWHDIKEAFPIVPGVSSIVMVTTAIQSVANACSTAHGHAYVMKTLAEEHSRRLFFKEASLEDPPAPGDHTTLLSTSEVLTKCDGLPLALITTAQFLQSKGDPRKWTNLCENLGKHLETKETLARMKRVLVNSYTSLGSQDVRTCLLYMGIYPGGHPIRRGNLIRRWLAEGLIKEDHKRSALSVAIDNFEELIDRSIIRPIDASSNNNIEVKKCQTHGMMLEFILHKSTCENFITLLSDKDPPPKSGIRWVSLQHQSAASAKMNPYDLRLVRSLTIFGKAHKSMLDFSKYELMRVLDLEECKDQMGDINLRDICNNLSLLRYLSLGGAVTVTRLPKEIKKLQLLETLDVRRTKIEILPTQVMELPCLVHLFGKFKLLHKVGDRRMGRLQTWLSENSKLETLAGFVVDNSQELPQLMGHMEHLTKVKIWCESTNVDAFASNNLSNLSKAVKEFIERGTQLNEARSLTLNINNEWSRDLLNFPLGKDYSYYLRTLKLHGNKICSQLPLFVTMLGGLTKLCLSFSGGHKLSGNILDALSRVRGLEYLKLIATQLDRLIIGPEKLQSLRHLCLVVELVTQLEIQDGALPRLDSLQLLCRDLNGFSSTMIQSLTLLKEVTLHDGLSNQTKQEWKEATKNHPRCPKLLFKLMGSDPAAETSTTATTDTIAQEAAVDVEPVDNSESPAVPPKDVIFSVTMSPSAISNGESAVTSEMGSEPAAPANTDNTTLSVNYNTFANSQQEYSVQVVTSEMGGEPGAEIPVALTTTNSAKPENHAAFSNAHQEYQVDGDGQHEDRETEDIDNTDDPKYIPRKNGPVTNMESLKKDMKGVSV
ncbi:hypothetical protein ZWY2020_047531 [Hordeum vulgare]|nr:hypothetical protein ZWY2020_047531 [Hordeum vulgare]